MAEFYVGSDWHAAITQWSAGAAISAGDIRRPTTGAQALRAYRAGGAGTTGGSEPAWPASGTVNDNGITWTEVTGVSTYGKTAAAGSVAIIISKPTAGDTIYVSDAHNVAIAAATTYTNTGVTFANPLKILCVATGCSVPPVDGDASSGGVETTSGGNGMTLSVLAAYIRGLEFSAGSGANNATMTIGSGGAGVSWYKFEDCVVGFNSTGATGRLIIGGPAGGGALQTSYVEMINTQLRFQATTHLTWVSGEWIWRHTSTPFLGAATPAVLVETNSVQTTKRNIRFQGIDFSGYGSGKAFFDADVQTDGKLIDCKLNASVTICDTLTGASNIELINCSDGAHYNRNQKYGRGIVANQSLVTETTIVRTSGASDGEQAVSWKVTTSTSNGELTAFECFPLFAWCATAGSPVTATVEIVNDGATLTNAEAWLEINYPADASSPRSGRATSHRATLLTTPANLATSSEAWTTTGLASPVKQKLEVTFTPARVGLVTGVVRIGRAAAANTYVDPLLSVAA